MRASRAKVTGLQETATTTGTTESAPAGIGAPVAMRIAAPARTATSGAIEGNPASLGVSRKLGYEIVGAHDVSPRGVPVEHLDLELTRERFTSVVAVEIDGLEGLQPQLGA